MKIAVMQPYLFPYLGYFQLVKCVDHFVFFDDVNFIMRGWINRNRYLLNGEAKLFTVPLNKASQNRRICDIEVSEEEAWRPKFLKSLYFAYQKAPYFKEVYPLVETVLNEGPTTICAMAEKSVLKTMEYLDFPVRISKSSEHGFQDLKGKNRILAICKKLGATEYVNPIGGTDLYKVDEFKSNGVELFFIKGRLPTYPQLDRPPVVGLSMLDVLMFNSTAIIRDSLNDYDLIQPSEESHITSKLVTPSEAVERLP